MKRQTLVTLELFVIKIITLLIFYAFFNIYFIFKGIGKSIVNINEKNKKVVENILKESKYYDKTNDINELKQIKFFMDFNDFQFTLYYKDGKEIELYDDSLYNLKDYIKNNGYIEVGFYTFIDVILLFICIGLNAIRNKISRKIYIIDNQDEK